MAEGGSGSGGIPPSPRGPHDETHVIPVRPHRNVGVRMEEGEEEEDLFMRTGERDISLGQKLSYGFGHFYNDLCASMWFTYLMIFLEKVIKLQAAQAGFLMLIGQVVDAISTPIIGIASDSSSLPKCLVRIGRRTSWHMIGTVLVTLSFPFIFNSCLLCDETTAQWWHVAWFIPFIALFQFGWASVQISHLALIPDLSHVDSSRRTMNSLRYGGTVLANLAVFGLLLYLLGNCSSSEILDAHDLGHFRLAGFIVVGVGLVSCLPFYLGTREPVPMTTYSRLNSTTSHASQLSRMHWTSWFGHVQFYQIALLYMLSRLYMNISQVYMPFYLTIVQGYSKTFVATIPMISFISSFFVSTVLSIPAFNKRLNKKVLYVFALTVGTANCVMMNFALEGWKIYAVAAVLGIAQSILLVTSLDITADLINKNTESGAFVYGAMSLADKLANGIAYQIIELLNPNCDTAEHSVCSGFYRTVMVYVPAVCLVASFIVLLSLIPADIGARGGRRRMRPEDVLSLIQEESERQEREERAEQAAANRNAPPTSAEAPPTNAAAPPTNDDAPPTNAEAPPTNDAPPPTNAAGPSTTPRARPTTARVPSFNPGAQPTTARARPTIARATSTNARAQPTSASIGAPPDPRIYPNHDWESDHSDSSPPTGLFSRY